MGQGSHDRFLCLTCAAWIEDDVWEEWHAQDGLHAESALAVGDWDLVDADELAAAARAVPVAPPADELVEPTKAVA
jgi:hypothetical protein